MPDIFSNMLTKSQVHQKSDDHVSEDGMVYTVVANGCGIDNHDHALEDVQTLGEGVISKNEIILMACTINSKKYRLISTGTQSVKDMSAHIEENVGLTKLNIEQLIVVESRNVMLFADKYGSVYDPFAHLGDTKLIPRLLCIMKVKLYQINVKSYFFNRYLNMDVNLDAPSDINNMEGVNMRDCEDLIIYTMLGRMEM